VCVLLGDGTGTNWTKRYFGAGDNAYGLHVGDINHDGHLDIAVANKDAGKDVSVLLLNRFQ
jgi:VCBS repeat protein